MALPGFWDCKGTWRGPENNFQGQRCPNKNLPGFMRKCPLCLTKRK